MKNRLINSVEYQKQYYRKLSIFQKIQWHYWDIEMTIQEYLHKHLGIGEHSAIMGRIGSKKYICLVCGKKVISPSSEKKI